MVKGWRYIVDLLYSQIGTRVHDPRRCCRPSDRPEQELAVFHTPSEEHVEGIICWEATAQIQETKIDLPFPLHFRILIEIHYPNKKSVNVLILQTMVTNRFIVFSLAFLRFIWFAFFKLPFSCSLQEKSVYILVPKTLQLYPYLAFVDNVALSYIQSMNLGIISKID